MGIGRNNSARSVIILTGAEDKYNVTMSMHLSAGGRGKSNVAGTGRHWKMLSSVKAVPATLTTASVQSVVHLKTRWFFDKVR